MLYSYASPTLLTSDKPVIVFLHGLLGSSKDWNSVIYELGDHPTLSIDLPGHGFSTQERCADFRDCCDQISDTILTQIPSHRPIVLVGYSLGGRIAMVGVAKEYFPNLNIVQLVIEGGNFGLQKPIERETRLASDGVWAERFNTEPIEQVLNDWYQQPVFSSLNNEQRQKMIAKRSANLGDAIASMLLSTSLAKQDYLLDALKASGVNIHYICGEKDNKFSQLAKQSGLSFSQIAGAGHNVHVEQPIAFANTIHSIG